MADPLMPFEGGEEGGTRHVGHGGRIESARATQAFFAAAAECSGTPSTENIETLVHDGTHVVRRAYSNCAGGAEVRWYEIEGGGHRWPPHQGDSTVVESLARRAFGTSSQNLDATQTLWAFFAAHPKR